MQIIPRTTITSPLVLEFAEQLRELNFVRLASEAAQHMQFRNQQELDVAVRRAIEICVGSELQLEDHFRRIYICSDNGIVTDWKLSMYAYQLVCLNGSPTNTCVARLQTSLVKAMS